MLSILNLSFGQRGLIVNAPVHRPRAFVDKAALDETRKQARGLGFIVIRHCHVGIVPLAENAEPLKIARLPLQSIRGKFAARAANAERRHVGLLRAEFALDMQLDRQPVTVIPGHVGRVVTQHRARFDDEVFQVLVERGAQVNIGISVGWTIVQDKFLSTCACPPNLLVKIHLGPFLQADRFTLRQVGLLRKFGFGQVDGLFQIKCRCFSGHKRQGSKTK